MYEFVPILAWYRFPAAEEFVVIFDVFFLFNDAPNVLYRWKIWVAGRPIQHIDSSITKPCCCNSCSMWFCIVLLKCVIWRGAYVALKPLIYLSAFIVPSKTCNFFQAAIPYAPPSHQRCWLLNWLLMTRWKVSLLFSRRTRRPWFPIRMTNLGSSAHRTLSHNDSLWSLKIPGCPSKKSSGITPASWQNSPIVLWPPWPPNHPHALIGLHHSVSSPPISWCVVSVLAQNGCRSIIQVDAAHWWWMRGYPAYYLKCFECLEKRNINLTYLINLQIAWWVEFTDSGFWKYSWAHLVMSMTESCRWVMQCRLKLKTTGIQQRSSTLSLTRRDYPFYSKYSTISVCTFTDWRASAHL